MINGSYPWPHKFKGIDVLNNICSLKVCLKGIVGVTVLGGI